MRVRIINRLSYQTIRYEVQVKHHWYVGWTAVRAYATLEDAMVVARQLVKEKEVYEYGKDFT